MKSDDYFSQDAQDLYEISQEWDGLGISNDFFFGKVMQDPYLCQKLLERILPQLKIERIEYPELQKSIRPDANAKSVRLDVYVKDSSETVYDIEMQAVSDRYLPQRSRYYQSIINLQLLDAGQDYARLNSSFVIFICREGIFDRKRHIYTFRSCCQEDPSLILRDGATKIFLSAAGTLEDVSPKLRAFLDYVAGETSDDIYVQELEKAVRKAKHNREWRHEYMTIEMRERVARREAFAEGEASGLNKGKNIGIILGTILTLRQSQLTDADIAEKLKKQFSLSAEEIEGYLKEASETAINN